jgi:hypothetical protein
MLAQLATRVVRATQVRLYRRLLDHGFDRKHGIETNGIHRTAELCLHGENAAHSSRYEATPVGVFHRAIDSLGVDFRRFVFVDLGSGKGRTLLLAAERPFLRVEGVELADNLHRIASANIAYAVAAGGLRAPINTRHMDATKYEMPREPFILYIFNPFGEPVISHVLGNVERSLRTTSREGYIVYVNAKHRQLFDREPFLAEMPRSRWARLIDRVVFPWPVVIYRTVTR